MEREEVEVLDLLSISSQHSLLLLPMFLYLLFVIYSAITNKHIVLLLYCTVQLQVSLSE